MKRWLFNLATVVSLVLFIATVLLWLRSLIVWDTLNVQLPERAVFIDNADGRLRLATVRHVREYPILKTLVSHQTGQVRYAENTFGPRSSWPIIARHHVGFIIIVPHWLFATLTAPMPLYGLFWGRRWRRRLGSVLCPTCGYDLRATPDRCP